MQKIEIVNSLSHYNQLATSIAQANLSMAKALEGLQPCFDSVVQIQQWQKHWANMLEPMLSVAKQVAIVQESLRKECVEIAGLSNLARQVFERLPLNAIGNLLQVTASVQAQLRNPLISMGISYERLWSALEVEPISIIKFPSVVVRQPPVDLHLSAHLAEVITEEPHISEDEEAALETNHQQANTFLCEALNQLNKDLLTPYQGAIVSLTSKNPDKVRHLAASLRELFTQVLHILSPDNKFEEWNTDLGNLKDGQPTRAGRLQYVYRDINFPPFNEFVEKDIDAALSFINLFQRGTHQSKVTFSGQCCRALLFRMESLLYFMIKVSPDIEENSRE